MSYKQHKTDNMMNSKPQFGNSELEIINKMCEILQTAITNTNLKTTQELSKTIKLNKTNLKQWLYGTNVSYPKTLC